MATTESRALAQTAPLEPVIHYAMIIKREPRMPQHQTNVADTGLCHYDAAANIIANLTGIDPGPAIYQILLNEALDQPTDIMTAGTDPTVKKTAASEASFDPGKLLHIPMKLKMIHTWRENTTAVRMGSGISDDFVVEFFRQNKYDPPPIMTTSYGVPAINRPDMYGYGKVAVRHVADFSGTADLAKNQIGLKGAADVQVARIPLGDKITFVAVTRLQLYIVSDPNQKTQAASPGAGFEIEMPGTTDQPFRIGIGGGPLLRQRTDADGNKSKDMTPLVMGTLEMLFF